MSSSPTATLGAGTEFGSYSIIRQVGRGAFGVVYEARRNPLKKRIALKVLHEHVLSTPDAITRFQREIMAAAQVEHPHVIQVFDGGVHEERGFLAMEFLEGETLGERLKREKVIDAEEVIDVMLPIASALDAVHNVGVVHRDIKPGNIFLARHVTGLTSPRLVDFGIAKLLSDDLDLTQTHSWLGTPFYMSPEQVRQSKNVDARSDQWSLAIVLYECLTGEKPFRHEVLLDLLEAITTRTPPPPSTVHPAVPKGLDAVIARMMERDPARRFPSMRAAGAALWPFATPRLRALWARHFDREGDPAARVDDVIEARDSGMLGEVSTLEHTKLRAESAADPATLHVKVAADAPKAIKGTLTGSGTERPASAQVPPSEAPRMAWTQAIGGAAIGVAAVLLGQNLWGTSSSPATSGYGQVIAEVADAAVPRETTPPPSAPLPSPPVAEAQPTATTDVVTVVDPQPMPDVAPAAVVAVVDAGRTASTRSSNAAGTSAPSLRGAPYCDDDPVYREACGALQSGDRSTALRAFQSLRGARALVAVAHLYRQSGRLVEAEEKLEQAMRDSSDAWMSSHTSFTNGLLNEVQNRLGYIQVECTRGEVTIGGSRRYELPRSQPLRSPAGHVQVVISHGGNALQQYVDVRAGDTARLSVCGPAQ
jgi:serine/threonine-protein kinase